MATLWVNQPGVIVSVEDPDIEAPFRISIDNEDASTLGIITRIITTESVAANFQLSLDRRLFITALGYELSPLIIAGMIPVRSCKQSSAYLAVDEFFAKKNVLVNKKPVSIAISNADKQSDPVINAFLNKKLTTRSTGPDGFVVYEFSLEFVVNPRKP
jgi:hypothetical protein